MNAEEVELAERFYAAIQYRSKQSARSLQSLDNRTGISDIGHCAEYTRRQIIGEPFTDDRDVLPAFLGTAIGLEVEQAVAELWPGALTQVPVRATFAGDQGVYEVPGHIDLLLPVEGGVVDVKTSDGVETARRNGPNRQQWYQRNLYALGAWQADLFGDKDLSDLWTANVWVDRSGRTKDLVVHRAPFSESAIKEAASWNDDIVYAVRHAEEAQREQPREFCQAVCERFTACRGWDTDAEGLLTDPTILTAVDILLDSRKLNKEADRLKQEAQAALEGVSGSTGTHTVRWVNVPGGHIEYDRKSYTKLSVMPVAR